MLREQRVIQLVLDVERDRQISGQLELACTIAGRRVQVALIDDQVLKHPSAARHPGRAAGPLGSFLGFA